MLAALAMTVALATQAVSVKMPEGLAMILAVLVMQVALAMHQEAALMISPWVQMN